MKKILFLTLLFIFCGYSFHSLLPSYIKRVEITQLRNSTTREFLEEYLREDITEKFMKKGFEIVPYRGDMSLDINITKFHKDPHYFDAKQNVYRWKIEISASVVCVDEVKGVTLWRGTVTGVSIYNNEEDEEENVKKAMEELSSMIVERTLTAW